MKDYRTIVRNLRIIELSGGIYGNTGREEVAIFVTLAVVSRSQTQSSLLFIYSEERQATRDYAERISIDMGIFLECCA